MKKVWKRMGNTLMLSDTTTDQKLLNNIVYSVSWDDKIGCFLEEKFDKFHFDFKIYGMEKEFIKRALNTYNHTKGNMGILLNGVKGTGKTITAEILSMI